jgi:hypothetical protein
MNHTPRSILPDIDETVWRAPQILADIMFPPDARTGWLCNLLREEARQRFGFVPTLDMWEQHAECAACGMRAAVIRPIPHSATDDTILDIIAVFGEHVWEGMALDHVEDCDNRAFWDELIAAMPALGTYLAMREEQYED